MTERGEPDGTPSTGKRATEPTEVASMPETQASQANVIWDDQAHVGGYSGSTDAADVPPPNHVESSVYGEPEPVPEPSDRAMRIYERAVAVRVECLRIAEQLQKFTAITRDDPDPTAQVIASATRLEQFVSGGEA